MRLVHKRVEDKSIDSTAVHSVSLRFQRIWMPRPPGGKWGTCERLGCGDGLSQRVRRARCQIDIRPCSIGVSHPELCHGDIEMLRHLQALERAITIGLGVQLQSRSE